MAVDSGQLAFAMVLAIVLIAVIIACANYIRYFGKKHPPKSPESQSFCLEDNIVPVEQFILFRVLLDKNGHASLSTFQFLLWTLLIAFLYLTLWFLQFLNGDPIAPPPIPESLMALMGISVAVPLVDKGIMNYKQFKTRPEGEVYREPNYASMLEESGRPSLLRLQMFLWTLAAIVIYFGSFLTAAFYPETVPGTFGLTEIDPTLLFLMGLSQTGYLGSKAYAGEVKKSETGQKTSPQPPAVVDSENIAENFVIRETIPEMARPKEVVSLLGTGFGAHKDTIMLGLDRVPAANIRRWDDGRIEFTIPETTAPGKYPVRVLVGGRTTEGTIRVSESQWTGGFSEIPADIVSDIWIDDITQKGYRIPPIGYFITDRQYHFFFEFAVPPGTPSWGDTTFKAQFYVNGNRKKESVFMPGNMNGNNYGFFDYTFTAEGTYTLEIRGATIKSMTVDAREPPGAKGGGNT